MVDLSNSTVVITGGGSGIGRAMATEFTERGANVAAIDLDEDGLREIEAAVADQDRRVHTSRADVTDRESVTRSLDEILDDFGTIDVLCNNAGVHDGHAPVGDTSQELWNDVLATNLDGVFVCTKAALPALSSGDDEGVVINTASISGKRAGKGGAAYTASKHGVVGFTKQFAYDYGPDVRANAICPGFTETGLTEDVFENGPDEVDAIVESTPLDRYACPEEIARVAVFLASDDASFIHGAAVDVDGGRLVD